MQDPATLDLRDDAAAFAVASPARKLLYMVLLLAVKDRASEVRFDPVVPGEVIRLESHGAKPDDDWTVPPHYEWHGCRLRYCVGGLMYDMVPSPFPTEAIAQEVTALTGPRIARRPLRHLLGRLAGASRTLPRPVEGWVQLLVGDQSVPVHMAVHPGDPSECHVVLRLGDPSEASAAAKAVLDRYLQRGGGRTPTSRG